MDTLITKRTKLLLSSIAISTLLLLNTPPNSHHIHVITHLQSTSSSPAVAARHCNGTLYPALCVSTLTSIPNLTSKSLPQIISAAVNHTVTAVHSTASNCSSIFRHHLPSLDHRQKIALSDCLELFDQTIDDLRRALLDLSTNPSSSSSLSELRTVLSAAITNQYTCLDGFSQVNSSVSLRPAIEEDLYHISHLVSNSLAMAKKISEKGKIALENMRLGTPIDRLLF